MMLDTLKVMLSSPAAQSLATAKPADFDRLLDALSEFASDDGLEGDGCIGIRDFVLGVRRGRDALEVHWIQSLRQAFSA